MVDHVLRVKNDSDEIFDIAEQRTDSSWAVAVNDKDAVAKLSSLATKLDLLLTELGQKVEAGDEVALTAATVTALQNVDITGSTVDVNGIAAIDATLDSLLAAVGDTLTSDTVIELLARIYGAVDGLELTADQLNLNTDQLEAKLDAIKASIDGQTTDGLTDAELRATPVQVDASGRRKMDDLSFTQTLGVFGVYATPWVDVQACDWLDFTASISPSAAVRAVLEFTDAPDPNTTPPAATDISRDLTVTLGGSALGGLDEPSFGIPSQMKWARITVVDLTGGQTITIATYAQRSPAGNALLPLATTPDKSFRAALTKSVLVGENPSGDYADVPLDGNLIEDSSVGNGTIPSGAIPAWDQVGPISAPNVIDTGWIDVRRWNYQLLQATFNIEGVKVYLIDAEDDQGNGSIYNTLQFAFPTAVSQGPGTSINVGAPFINNYFRIIIVNDTGTTLTEWNYRSHASAVAPGSIFLSIDQPIFDFFPAPLVQSILKGKEPDGNYSALPISGSDSLNTTHTPLLGNQEFTGTWRNTTGFLGGMVVVESDVVSDPNGIIIEFTEDDPSGPTVHVHRRLTSTYDNAGVGQPRFFPVMQGEYYRIRYINGPIPQARFVCRTELLAASAQSSQGALNAPIDGNALASISRSALLAPDENDDWDNVQRTSDGLKVDVSGFSAETPIKPKEVWGVRGANVGSGAAVLLPKPPLTGIGTFSIANEGVGSVYIAPSSDDAVDPGRRRKIAAGGQIELDLGDSAAIWAIADASDGLTSTTRESGNSATGGTNPNNALTSNDVNAVVAADQVLEVTGFTAPQLFPVISSVVVGFEGAIQAGAPSTETIEFVDEYDAAVGNVGSITSPSITVAPSRLYIATITTRKAEALVNSVSGLGLTWSLAGSPINDDSGANRVSVWIGSGTPSDGTVTAIFSETAQNATMKVTGWDGVDLTTPIDNYETLGIAGSSNSYSDSINGVERGMALTVVTSARRVHTPGAGFTELTKVNTGTGPNDSRQSVSYLSLTSTGSHPYSGTFSGNADWVLAALTLKPRAIQDPTVTVSYEVDGIPGPTTQSFQVDELPDDHYRVNITADRAWDATDIANLSILVDGSQITSANVAVDHVFLDLEEAEDGASQFVTVTVVGDQ